MSTMASSTSERTGTTRPLLEVTNLVRHYPVRSGILQRTTAWVHAVDDISFSLEQGKTFGLVGESGCGKTTTARQVLLVERPPEGAIQINGRDIAKLKGGELRRHRREVQAVFQDPYSSLNPRMRVRDILLEPMSVHGMYARGERKARVAELLRVVGLNPYAADLFPHQFSGGQRQRIAIARALTLEPKLIVLDEPVSALDVSIRAQVLNLLRDIQEHTGVSYLLIAHDLAIVAQTSHEVGVMYLGNLVERAPSRELVASPLHPYTQALFAAALPPDPRLSRSLPALQGEVPSPINPPAGCRFHTRCPQVMERCKSEAPAWKEAAAGHYVACHLY
jgi:peptide/nickel transport system ATP-binding protein/oligopeptide transport system ATP-binding protein